MSEKDCGEWQGEALSCLEVIEEGAGRVGDRGQNGQIDIDGETGV